MKIQVGAKMKEKGSQADMRPRVRSIGVQCNGTDIPPPLPIPDIEPARNEPSSSCEESSETDSDTRSVYEPSSTGSEESQIQDDQNDVGTMLWKKPNSSSPSPSWWSCLVSVGDVIDMLWIVFNTWLEQWWRCSWIPVLWFFMALVQSTIS